MNNSHENSPINVSVFQIYENPYLSLHNHLSIIIVLLGEIEIRFTSGAKQMTADDIEFINIEEPASLSGNGDNVVMIVSFQNEFVQKRCPNIEKMLLNCDCDFIFPSNADQKNIQNLRKYINETAEAYLHSDEHNTQILIAKCQDLLEYIIHNFNSISNVFKNLPNADLHVSRFSHINDYLRDNLEKKISLRDMASREYLSMQYLSNEFRKKYGICFHEILSYYRIVHSIKLLIKTNMRIMDIAEKCGFSATRYYYKYFKKYLSMSPNAYRNAIRQQLGEKKNYKELELTSTIRDCGLLPSVMDAQIYNPDKKKKILLINPNTSDKITRLMAESIRENFTNNICLEAISAPFGPACMTSGLDERVSEIAVLEALLSEKGSYDGVIIGSFGDVGVSLAKKILSVPVIGIAEAAYHCACLLGDRFSVIITGHAAEIALTWAAIRRNGLEGRCASVRSLGIDLPEINDGINKPLEQMILLAQKEDGVDVVVLACAALAGRADAIADRLPIPVVDGVTQAALLIQSMLLPGWRKLLKPPQISNTNHPYLGGFHMSQIENLYIK